MALTTLSGMGMEWPPIPPVDLQNPASALNTTALVIDATGEKLAMVGRHWNETRTTKSIRKVGVLFGSVTKAGGSGLTLSLQDVDATTGNPIRPDGTQDQTVAIAAAAVTANTFLLSGNLSADRSVAHGELLAVVLEFDGGGRLGADSFAVAKWVAGSSGSNNHLQSTCLLNTAAWAENAGHPIVLFEYDDGTFGTLNWGMPTSAGSTFNFNSGSTPDEYALEFTVPVPMKVDGAWVHLFASASADFDVVLYEGTTAMTNGTVSVDNDQFRADNAYSVCRVTFAAEITLATSTTYRLAVKPTTANAVIIPYYDVSAAGHLACWPGGTSMAIAHRTDAGAFTSVTTRRIMAGLRISSLDNGAGGSGGGIPILGGNILRVAS